MTETTEHRAVMTWEGPGEPTVLALYGPEGGAAGRLLPKRVLVLGVLAPVVRDGAAGVRALLKQAGHASVKASLAKASERFLRRQVELGDASPFDAAPAAGPSMPHA